MSYTPNNPNGSALSASSAPVVIASDQLAISTKDTIVGSTIPTATVMQNAAVAVGVGINLNVQGYASAIISISGTMSGSTIVFKESPDDVTFSPIAAHQLGITGNLLTTTTSTGEFRISCAGLKSLQAVITVYGTGSITVKGFASPLAGHGTTVNANIIAALPAGTNTVGNVLVTDGTNVVNVLKADGTAAGQNSQLVAGSYLSVPFTTTVAANVGSTDVGNYKYVNVQISAQGTGSTVIFQISNDNTNWNSIGLMFVSPNPSNSTNPSTTTVGSLSGSTLGARYFRLSITGISALTTSGTIMFSAIPGSNLQTGAASAQSGTWTVGSNSATGSAVPANAFYMAGLGAGGILRGFSMGGAIGSDADSAASSLASVPWIYNGTSYDRVRNNTSGAIIAAGATTAQTSTTQNSYNAKRLHAVINISAFTSGTLTFTVNAITASGYTYPLLTSTALAAVGLTVLRIFDGATPVANLTANDSIPRSFTVVVSGTFVATYGVDFNLGV